MSSSVSSARGRAPHPGSAGCVASPVAGATDNRQRPGRAEAGAPTESRDTGRPIPTVTEIMAAAGIGREAANSRLRQFRRGERNLEMLLESKAVALARCRRGGYQGAPDRLGNAAWRALSSDDRRDRLSGIPGPTATERRLFGDDCSCGPQVTPERAELVRAVMAATGMSRTGAGHRVDRYLSGVVSYSGLFRGSQRPVAPARVNLSEEITRLCDRTGVSRSTAGRRLRKFRAGRIDEAALYAPPKPTGGNDGAA